MVPFVNLKCEKHPCRSVDFSQVAGFSLYKWYQIAQSITYSILNFWFILIYSLIGTFSKSKSSKRNFQEVPFFPSAILLPHSQIWATGVEAASLTDVHHCVFTYFKSKVTGSLVVRLGPKAWGLNREPDSTLLTNASTH